MCRRKKKKRRSCFVASLLGVSAYLPPLEGFFTPVLSPLPKKDPVGRCVCVVLGIAVTFWAPSTGVERDHGK